VKAPVISAIGHTALRVRDLPANIEFLDRFLGLRETERIDETAYLTHGSPHHSHELIAADANGLDHIGLEASGAGALEEIRARAAAGGHRILQETPIDPMLAEGFVLEGPEGFVFEIYVGMPGGQPNYHPRGLRPNRFGHVNLKSKDPEAFSRFLVDVFDFRVSDRFEPPSIVFLRCNVDHHAIAMFPGDSSGLHHHAWETQGIADLGRLGDRLDENGERLIWGPVRHGVGRNIAVYFTDPTGAICEVYTDMERIYDELGHEPGVWSVEDSRYYSFWAPMRPGPEFRAAGVESVPWGVPRFAEAAAR
jgi:catechol 2,3-dioxygenase